MIATEGSQARKQSLKYNTHGLIEKLDRLYKAGHWPCYVAQCTTYVAAVVDIIMKSSKHGTAIVQKFVDDTSILIKSLNSNQLRSDLNIAFAQQKKWFESNLLFLNFDKTHFIQFSNASKCTSKAPTVTSYRAILL